MADKVRVGRSSWFVVERSIWTMDYGLCGGKQKFTENGLEIYISKKDSDFAANSLKNFFYMAAEAAGGLVAAETLGKLAGIVVDILDYLMFDEDGLHLHVAPHGFQCGSLEAFDPNVAFLGLWQVIRPSLDKLNSPSRPLRKMAEHRPSGATESAGQILRATPLRFEQILLPPAFPEEPSVHVYLVEGSYTLHFNYDCPAPKRSTRPVIEEDVADAGDPMTTADQLGY